MVERRATALYDTQSIVTLYVNVYSQLDEIELSSIARHDTTIYSHQLSEPYSSY
jgi:hypothetical protein